MANSGLAKGKDLLGLELFLEWLLPELLETLEALDDDLMLMEDEVSSANPLTRSICAVFRNEVKHS